MFLKIIKAISSNEFTNILMPEKTSFKMRFNLKIEKVSVLPSVTMTTCWTAEVVLSQTRVAVSGNDPVVE